MKKTKEIFLQTVIDNVPKDLPVEVQMMWVSNPKLLREVLKNVLYPEVWNSAVPIESKKEIGNLKAVSLKDAVMILARKKGYRTYNDLAKAMNKNPNNFTQSFKYVSVNKNYTTSFATKLFTLLGTTEASIRKMFEEQ